MALAAPALEARPGMNALIIETAFLGDAIVSLSLARAIKEARPGAEVTYLVRPGVAEVLLASPDVAQAIVFDKHGAESGPAGIRIKADELNARGFDTLFLLHSSRRSQSLARMLNVPAKIGFEAMTHAGLTAAVPDSGWRNRYERAALLLQALIPGVPIAALPRIIPPAIPEIERFVSRFERSFALAPGSAWETKRWGDDKYLELAKALSSSGLGVIVIGGNAEAEIGRRIREACPEGAVLDLPGHASFLESMYAIARSELLVANDSAPVHAAVAVGTKVFAIYGPTVPNFGFAPPEGRGEVIELDGLWCRPCTPHGSHECPIYSHECMNRIGESTVIERIMRVFPVAIGHSY